MNRLETLFPRPRHFAIGEGEYLLSKMPSVCVPHLSMQRTVALLPVVPIFSSGIAGDIVVTIEPNLSDEAYRLRIGADGIAISTAGTSGLSCAIQTIRQLLPADGLRSRVPDDLVLSLPFCEIEDKPTFGWRGTLLDPARHFIPKTELLRQIDGLALHKINRLQLHLTDEQGWRVESLRFPRLTAVGSVRRRTQVSHFLDARILDETPHGGFYSQDDIREICSYASDRGITVVPEIELPGHTGALLAAYPELGSPPDAYREVLGTWGIHDTVLAPIAATVEFLRELFHEIGALFPGPYVHVGGDESLLGAWANDARVSSEAASRGLTSPAAIFAEFMTRVAGAVHAAGKTMITWDDCFATADTAGKIDADTTIMAWRGMDVARRAADAGQNVILTPIVPTYFDYSESACLNEALSIGGPITVGDVAAWRPIPANWTSAQSSRVLGVQCQVWSEFIPTPRRIDYMLYPRLPVFADVAWNGKGSGAEDTAARLAVHMTRLAAMDLDARPIEGPHPRQMAGTGRYAHYPLRPMDEVVSRHEEGAELGITPFGVSDHEGEGK